MKQSIKRVSGPDFLQSADWAQFQGAVGHSVVELEQAKPRGLVAQETPEVTDWGNYEYKPVKTYWWIDKYDVMCYSGFAKFQQSW